MSGVIYLVHDGEHLVPMSEQKYDSEELLQGLLTNYPSLLAGDQVDVTTPRQWMLIAQEMGLSDEEDGSNRWSVDHLFIDQDAVPTIVEVKRSTDTRIRREVVGQMLDYAANAVVYWPVEAIRTRFETTCESYGVDPEQVITETFGPEVDPDDYWLAVKTNLQAGRVRLVFVSDLIPVELRRIIEYLSVQMNPTEVIGIEIKQYVGEGKQVLVPRIVGSVTPPPPPPGPWNPDRFDQALRVSSGENVVRLARTIRNWAEQHSMRIAWGKGKITGSCFLMIDHDGIPHWTVALWTDGQIAVQFGYMMTRPPFDQDEMRLEFLDRLNRIPGLSISRDQITKFPPFQMRLLENTEAMDQFFETLNWAGEQVRGKRESR